MTLPFKLGDIVTSDSGDEWRITEIEVAKYGLLLTGLTLESDLTCRTLLIEAPVPEERIYYWRGEDGCLAYVIINGKKFTSFFLIRPKGTNAVNSVERYNKVLERIMGYDLAT